MKNAAKTPSRIEALRRQIARLEGTCRHGEAVASGCGPLDRLLPMGGVRRGSLVEWLAGGDAAGAETLAMFAAREASRDGGAVVVIDQSREFCPVAAVRLGIELNKLMVVHAVGTADNAWALDQAMRCPGVAAVLARPEWHRGRLDSHTLRRLQLAAEQSDVLGLLIRAEAVRGEPSWADVRLLIEPLPLFSRQGRRLRIHLLRCRGGTGPRSIDVEIDDATHTVHPAAELADSAPAGRAAGA